MRAGATRDRPAPHARHASEPTVSCPLGHHDAGWLSPGGGGFTVLMGAFIGLDARLAHMAAKERPAFGMNHVTVVPENFELEPLVDDRDDE